MVPIVLGAKHVILVGDHCQLRHHHIHTGSKVSECVCAKEEGKEVMGC